MAKAKSTENSSKKSKVSKDISEGSQLSKDAKATNSSEVVIQLNQLMAFPNSTGKRKRVGRGNASGFGGECGRGHKGQKSRSGFSRKRGFEGGQNPLYKRIPKKRGFYNRFKTKYSIINLSNINLALFTESIEMKHLIDFNIVKESSLVKFVGNVPDGFAIKSIETHAISNSLKDKLEKLGCNIIILN